MWTIAGYRVYVQELPHSVKQIIARLQPIGGGTVHHVFGYENSVWKMQAYVVGTAHAQELKLLATSGIAYPLEGPEGVLGNFLVANVEVQQLQILAQTIDTSQGCDAPVYTVGMELYRT